MSKIETTVGLGLAMVDEKIHSEGIVLPSSKDLVSFLEKLPNTIREAGGVIPNIISALTLFSPDKPMRLLACTGNDIRGDFYKSKTNVRLGKLQTHPVELTGIVASAINNQGIVYQRERILGAAEQVIVGKEELETPTTLFMSDLTTLRLSNMFNQADRLLSSLAGGNFFLNLAGLNPAIAPREELTTALNNLRRPPDIITSNESEFEYLTGEQVNQITLSQIFPETRLLALTLAEKGSLIRYENQIIEIPAYPVQKVVDETGAGDTNAGIMLGVLYEKPYEKWTKNHILKAADTAAFGSSLVVSTFRTRLTAKEMEKVRRYSAYQDALNKLNKS